MDFELIIRDGTIVTEQGTYKADIGVIDGTIATIGHGLHAGSAEILDASDLLILPGAIDVHTHLDMPVNGTTTSDDFRSGSQAAAFGGTTTIVDYCIQEPGQTLRAAAATWHQKAASKSFIDYGFHIAITDAHPTVLTEIPTMIAAGYPSFKLFMTYDDARVSDGVLLDVLQVCGEHGGLVCVHAENHDIIDHLVRRFQTEGKTEPLYHEQSRPVLAETEATARAIRLAKAANAPLYIVHLSCADALREVQQGRANGVSVMAETCPQYLLLDNTYYQQPGFAGAKYVISPPLRTAENHEPLWLGLASGTLQVVATDHCPFNYEGQKDLGREFFGQIPNGGPGIETRLMLLHTYGVKQGRLTLEQLVKITSANPAKIFGLYPQKGAIQVGSDADLVLFDPHSRTTVRSADLHEHVDYTLFEGFELQGKVHTTLSKGRVLVRQGQWIDADPEGKFVPRKQSLIL